MYFLRIEALHTWKRKMSQRSQSIFQAILWMDYEQTAYFPNPDETNKAFPWLWYVGGNSCILRDHMVPTLEIFYAFKLAGW